MERHPPDEDMRVLGSESRCFRSGGAISSRTQARMKLKSRDLLYLKALRMYHVHWLGAPGVAARRSWVQMRRLSWAIAAFTPSIHA
jgi:hypothetical protein